MYSFKYSQLNIGKSVVLNEGNICLEPDKFTVLIGPNGCGKSSFVLELAGSRPSYVNGNGSEWSTNWEQIGFVCQNYHLSLFPWLGINGNLKFYSDTIDPEAKMLLFDFPENLSSINKLSGGMRQRLAIAKEIGISKKGLLILDEPFSGQHPKAREIIINALLNFKNKGGNVIIITHEYEILKSGFIQTYQFRQKNIDSHLPQYTLEKNE